MRLVRIVLMAVLAVSPLAGATEFINILTGSTAGVYYPVGVALSNIYTEGMPESRIQVQATRGSVENLNLLQRGRAELAFTLGDSLKFAWQGDPEAGFPKPLDRLRAVAALYPNYIQIVASTDSGIRQLADLRGKRVAVGPPKSGTEINARTVFASAGLTYADFARTEYLPFGESVELIRNRQLDATIQSAGLGVASIRDLASSVEIILVPVPISVSDSLGPPYRSGVIPANIYNGVTEEVETATVLNYLVTHEDVPETVVYEMTRLMFEHLDRLQSTHHSAEGIRRETAMIGLPLPLHEGAQRYYREHGLL